MLATSAVPLRFTVPTIGKSCPWRGPNGTGAEMFEPSAQAAEIPHGPTWATLRDSPHPDGEHSTCALGAHSARSTAPNRATTSATPQRPNVAPTPPPPHPRQGRSQPTDRPTCAQRSARRGQRRSVRVGGDPHSPDPASLGIGVIPPLLFFHTAEPGGGPMAAQSVSLVGILAVSPRPLGPHQTGPQNGSQGHLAAPESRGERRGRNAEECDGEPDGGHPPGRLAGVPAESLRAGGVVAEPLAGLVDLGGAACAVGGVEGFGLSSLVAQ